MQTSNSSPGTPNPQDLSIHKQVKDLSDLLRPELLRLHKCSTETSGNAQLYHSFIMQIERVKREVTNHDALFACRSVINHMKKAIELAENKTVNEEVLWHLQEVMALLCKIQTLPS